VSGPNPAVEELERVAALGWRATHTRSLGDWLLRAADGFTGRANSVLPLGSPGIELPEALVEVTEFYRGHALPARFQVPLDAPGTALAELDAALERRGWPSSDLTTVMTADIGAVLDACRSHPDLPPAELDDRPSAEWRRGYLYRGAPLPASAVAVLTHTPDPAFALVRRGDVRLGVATHLLIELARWAAGRGARFIYLQVGADNAAAIALYRGAGFTVHHRYHYRHGPEGAR
jgi:GNAT superfamily N-acetyltransferase